MSGCDAHIGGGALDLKVLGLGFSVWRLGFGVQGLGFRVWVLGFGVKG